MRALLDSGSWPFADIEFVNAVDGGSGRVPVPPGFISGGGAWGCRQSWCRVIEDCLMAGYESVLILEDDAMWRPDLPAAAAEFFANVPADWETVFLGGQNFGGTPPLVATGVCRTVNTQRTHAIGFKPEGLRHAYRVMASCDRHIDHKFGPAAGKTRTAYQPVRFLIGQDGTKSDISGRADHSRFWQTPEADYPVLWLQAEPGIASALTEYGIHYGYDLDESGIDRGLATSFPSPGRYAGGLPGFLRAVSWESASFVDDVGITTVWHPHADEQAYQLARRDLPDRVKVSPYFCELDAAVDWLKDAFGDKLIRRRRDRRRFPVLLVRSPQNVVAELREKGVLHIGRWLAQGSGIDMGLYQLFRSGGPVHLADWYRILESEARETNVPVGIYHPQCSMEIARTCGRDVAVIDAIETVEALKQVEDAIRC